MNEANRLSAEHMYLAKWVLPPIGLVVVTAMMFEKEVHKAHPHFMILTAAMIVVVIICAAVFRRCIWSLADEVTDGSEHLLVRFGSRRAQIKVSDVLGIDVDGELGATTIHLRLAVPCELGNRISFLARQTSRNPFAPNLVAQELVARFADRK